MLNQLEFLRARDLCMRVRTGALRKFCEHFFIALGRPTMWEFSKTTFLTSWQLSKVAQNRQILIILIIFTKKCWFWATLESCQSVRYCPIWTNFVLLNSHRVYLPRAIKTIAQKSQSAPVAVRTRKIWFERKMQLAITRTPSISNFIKSL